MTLDAASHTSPAENAKLRSVLSFCARYGAAVGVVLLALGIGFALQEVLGYRAPLILFVAASFAAAWFGGLGPGLLALVAGLLVGDFFFIPPLYRFGQYSPADLAMLLLYASVTSLGLAAILNLRHALERERQTIQWNKELEGRVRDRTAELEAFCYSVSHDLRAPIRSIASFTELLRENYGPCLDEEGRNMLQIVGQSAGRMDQLLSDLLKLARLSRKEMQWQTVDLSALAESIARNLHRTEPARQVDFVIAPGVTARGDEALLRVALENLLHNAWKFTGKRARGLISFGSEQHEGQPVYFVADNGIGFDMAHATKLFGVFERLHSAAEFPGTGIGLAIVQRVIGRHGGQIWAKAEQDKGATLSFTLPATQPALA